MQQIAARVSSRYSDDTLSRNSATPDRHSPVPVSTGAAKNRGVERDDRHGQASRDTGARSRGAGASGGRSAGTVSKRTVERVDAEVTNFDADAERKRRGIGLPSKAEPFRSFVVAELVTQPDVLAVELLRRAKLKGTSGKSALYTLVKEVARSGLGRSSAPKACNRCTTNRILDERGRGCG